MTTLAELLKPEQIELAPKAKDREAAILEIANLLEGMVEVLDWEILHHGLQASAPCISEQGAAFCICIPHARTAAVTELVMSVGRFDPPLPFSEKDPPVRYLFCIAVPPELATDYLRIIGLLARIVKHPKSEAQMHAAATAGEFIATLARLEARL